MGQRVPNWKAEILRDLLQPKKYVDDPHVYFARKGDTVKIILDTGVGKVTARNAQGAQARLFRKDLRRLS